MECSTYEKMSISKKYCQPCGAPPNIYDDGHIILLSQNCRDCIQPCSTLRLIPVRVRGGILMSCPPTRHHQPTRSRPVGYDVSSALLSLVERMPTCEGPHRDSTSSTHTSQFHTDSWTTELSRPQIRTRPHSEEAGSKPTKNPVRRQDDSTAQVSPYCRLYSLISSQYILTIICVVHFIWDPVVYRPPGS